MCIFMFCVGVCALTGDVSAATKLAGVTESGNAKHSAVRGLVPGRHRVERTQQSKYGYSLICAYN